MYENDVLVGPTEEIYISTSSLTGSFRLDLNTAYILKEVQYSLSKFMVLAR